MKRLFASVLFVALTLPALPKVDFPPQVQIRVGHAPEVAVVGGKRVLVYELTMLNMEKTDFALGRLQVLDERGRVLQTLDPDGIAKGLMRLPHDPKAPPDCRLEGGHGSILYQWVELPAGAPPRSLRHRFEFPVEKAPPKVVVTEPVAVNPSPLLTLQAPFNTAGVWGAGSAPSNSSVHRRCITNLEGASRVSQRFAIDWILFSPEGKIWTGDPSKNESAPCFHKPAVAVADATVAAVKDGIPNNEPGDSRAVVITRETIGGNWVALDLGSNHYAMYAHLSPGSIRVKPGQHVKAGEVLGLIGNSGNSDAPHLHFHVCDRPSWLASEGRPYLFHTYRKVGEGKLTEAPDTAPAYDLERTKPLLRTNSMPAEDEAIQLP